MFGFITKIVFLGIALQYFLSYRDWLDWESAVKLSIKPGPCKYITEDGGSEDLTYIGDGIVLMSTGFAFVADSPGAIKAFNTSSGTLETLSVEGAPSRSTFMSSPHGLSTWRDPKSGDQYLYVITHPLAADCVEVFQVMYEPLRLQYIKSITDTNFRFMNDLKVVDKDKFYITKFAHYRDNLKYQLELISRWRSGKIFFYDGHKSREVVSGLLNPNGINTSPDGSIVYMAEWGAKRLVAYRRESTNNLVELWDSHLDTGIDNIEVDPDTGDLWIGSHPLIWKVVDPLNLLNVNAAAQVLRIKMIDNAISEVEEILADDGDFIEGTSSATYANGLLIVGTVFKQSIVCEISRLSETNNESSFNGDRMPDSYVANGRV